MNILVAINKPDFELGRNLSTSQAVLLLLAITNYPMSLWRSAAAPKIQHEFMKKCLPTTLSDVTKTQERNYMASRLQWVLMILYARVPHESSGDHWTTSVCNACTSSPSCFFIAKHRSSNRKGSSKDNQKEPFLHVLNCHCEPTPTTNLPSYVTRNRPCHYRMGNSIWLAKMAKLISPWRTVQECDAPRLTTTTGNWDSKRTCVQRLHNPSPAYLPFWM